jgi:hypothetical protein
MSSITKSCPVAHGFCWRNPVHVLVGLALLPFAVAGLKTLVGWVSSLCSCAL